MFIYYEVFPSVAADKSDLITEVIISSNGQDNVLNWKNKQDKAYAELIVSVFKQIPIKNREFNESSKIWTFIGYQGEIVLNGIQSMHTQGMFSGCTIKQISELTERVRLRRLDKKYTYTEDEPSNKTGQKYNPEDFFYTPVSTTDSALSGTSLILRLAPLLLVSEDYLTKESDDSKLKSVYRKAALRLHPDRNNGDGSKMSELNMLWNLFMQRA